MVFTILLWEQSNTYSSKEQQHGMVEPNGLPTTTMTDNYKKDGACYLEI